MNGETVADIVTGADDATGAKILTVYSKVRETYAVYRTRERVGIQFADSPELGADQRKALAKLNPLRGQINGLIDGWRAAGETGRGSNWKVLFWRSIDSHEIRAKAAMFDRRVADALAMALQGDPDHAESLLADIKADLIEERTSMARIDYMAIASLTAALIVIIACILTRKRSQWIYEFSPVALTLWLACGAGALGALFSTGMAMRTRGILTDLQLRENRTDAIVRIFIGAMAGVLLVGMLVSGIVTFGLGDGNISLPTGHLRWVVVGFVAFVAGFSERLVPGLLERATAAAAKQRNPLVGPTATVPGSSGSRTVANETNPLGLARTADASVRDPGSDHTEELAVAEEHLDGCVEDTELDEAEATQDVELPAARGGVEQPVSPQS
ncbi:MAG TPA: hypothetical protein VF620_01400 [Allosphingosinicella sp.]|jgi:hypothetical protein